METNTQNKPTTYGPHSEVLAEYLLASGYENLVEVDTKPENGWKVETTDRAEAFSIARKTTNEFEGDPEAGDFQVHVQKNARAWAVYMIRG